MERLRNLLRKAEKDIGFFGTRDSKVGEKDPQKEFQNKLNKDPRVQAIRKASGSKAFVAAMQKFANKWEETSSHTHNEEKSQTGRTEWHHLDVDRGMMLELDLMTRAVLQTSREGQMSTDVTSQIDEAIRVAVESGIIYHFPQEIATYSTFGDSRIYRAKAQYSTAGSFNFRVSWSGDGVLYTIEQLDGKGNVFNSQWSSDQKTALGAFAQLVFGVNEL